MAVRMTVTGKRMGRMRAWREMEEFPSRAQALQHVRVQLGGIYRQSDEDYLESLKTVGVTIEFEEV
jgi:hypothetical protein